MSSNSLDFFSFEVTIAMRVVIPYWNQTWTDGRTIGQSDGVLCVKLALLGAHKINHFADLVLHVVGPLSAMSCNTSVVWSTPTPLVRTPNSVPTNSTNWTGRRGLLYAKVKRQNEMKVLLQHSRRLTVARWWGHVWRTCGCYSHSRRAHDFRFRHGDGHEDQTRVPWSSSLPPTGRAHTCSRLSASSLTVICKADGCRRLLTGVEWTTLSKPGFASLPLTADTIPGQHLHGESKKQSLQLLLIFQQRE